MGVGEIPMIRDTVEEAAELQRLDLLITVDTLSAHLAGALGVRTWTLLPTDADWRWMEDREDTPWYPTMRLFRQSKPGDWESVLARLTRELEKTFGRWLTSAANRASTCRAEQ
jgi:ADP-heptose:LPS heptosyltransferase